MSRRGRALAFLVGALLCAGLAAALAGSYERSVAEQLGALRPAVVATKRLPARRAITAREARRSLVVRRIPDRFAPPGVLTAPAQAVGLEPAADLAAGAYLVAGVLRPPRRKERATPRVSRGLIPVEIEVAAAGTLAASGPGSEQATRVDVVVTTEPGPGGRGRTYVAAHAIELLDLVEAGGAGVEDDPLATAASAGYTATLALTRRQAIDLIQAESFARQVRLIAHRDS